MPAAQLLLLQSCLSVWAAGFPMGIQTTRTNVNQGHFHGNHGLVSVSMSSWGKCYESRCAYIYIHMYIHVYIHGVANYVNHGPCVFNGLQGYKALYTEF